MSVTTEPNETSKSDTPPRRRRRTTPTASTPSQVAESGSQSGEGESSATSPPRPPKTERERKPRSGSLESRLQEWVGALAIPYATIGDEWAANLITERGPGIAKAWADLAAQNPAVKRVLEKMMQTSAWGAVIVSSASLAVPLLAHHGILPIPYDPFGSGPIPQRGEPRQMPSWGQRIIIPEPPRPSGDMTPPLRTEDPPGVFTVAGSNNGATMPPAAG